MKPIGRRVAILAGILAVVVLGLAGWLSWPHLRFYVLFEPLGKNTQGYLEYRHRQTGIVMVRLPGGKFWMGAQKTDPKGQNYDPAAEDAEGPVHEVTLSPFLIGKYEVTQAQWKAVMGSNPSNFKGDDDQPVEQVSWADIQRFQAKTGLSLPTEAMWEYACRGGSTAPIAGTGKLDEMGWHGKNSGATTHPVGKKSPNGFGLHDLHGNVTELCEDVYDEGFYWKPEAQEVDSVSIEGPERRVARGGTWMSFAPKCTSSSRDMYPPKYAALYLGFRAAWRWQ